MHATNKLFYRAWNYFEGSFRIPWNFASHFAGMRRTNSKSGLFCEKRMMRRAAAVIKSAAMVPARCRLSLRSSARVQGALRITQSNKNNRSVERLLFLAEFKRSDDVMSESDSSTTPSIERIDSKLGTAMPSCFDPTRRALILTALATGASIVASRPAAAGEDQPGSDQRPQKDDVLVVSEGEHEGQVIAPQDLKLGGPLLRAWPKDPKTSVVRNGSRLNEILVVRLDPAELDEETRARSADGIVAYSAICTHQGCPVTAWVKGATGDKDICKCFCHNSEFDPRQSAQVVFGPAPRRLAALPLTTAGGSLTVAATFVGKIGGQ
jgi:Rieske Fe-S protein